LGKLGAFGYVATASMISAHMREVLYKFGWN